MGAGTAQGHCPYRLSKSNISLYGAGTRSFSEEAVSLQALKISVANY